MTPPSMPRPLAATGQVDPMSGFPRESVARSEQCLFALYQPDAVWNYELGAKSEFLDRRPIHRRGLLIKSDWKKYSKRSPIPGAVIYWAPTSGTAQSKGFEAEINLQPFESLLLQCQWFLRSGKIHIDATRHFRGPCCHNPEKRFPVCRIRNSISAPNTPEPSPTTPVTCASIGVT